MNAKLLKQISDNLTPLDTSDMYRTFLEECYGEITLGNLTFSAARIIEELDPTAFRCGEADYIDSLSLVEIQGDYYEQDAVEQERDGLIEELESELSDLEEGLLENEKDIKNEVISEEAGMSESERLQAEIDALTAEIEEIKEYCF